MNDVAAASAILVPFVRSLEGCRLDAYLPTPNDRPTIGYGSTFHRGGMPVRLGEVITQAEADELLAMHLAADLLRVSTLAGRATPRQLAAMTSLAYNVGFGGAPGHPGFGQSAVLERHRAGDFPAAAAGFALWNRQAGRVLPGLVNRRRREAALYLEKA